MYNSKEKAIREEARAAIIKALQDGYTGYYYALYAEVFKTDYFIIDTYQAKEALEEYGVWDAIAKVQAYEKNNFGGIYTDLSDPEQLLVMLYSIIGEEVLLEMMDGVEVWNENRNNQADEETNAEILKAIAEKEDDHMKMDWNETFDLNEHGDFFAHSVECEEGSQYVYFHGTYRNIKGQEFPGAILEVFLSDPVQLDADGDIIIPSAWENYWVLGRELEEEVGFDIEEAFGVSYVFVSSDWERYLYSFTDDYQKYPPRIAPHPSMGRLGLYYFDKDVAVLVTPAGIYSYGAASLSLRGPAYRPLSKFFEIWGECE